jgi:hypothetical protein
VDCGVYLTQNVDTLFFIVRWAQSGSDKKCVVAHYTALLCMQPVRSTRHVVHSSASTARNIDALFFMLRWARCGTQNKSVGTSYAELVFLHPVGSTGHIVQCGASEMQNINAVFFELDGPVADPTKSAQGHITLNMYFCI